MKYAAVGTVITNKILYTDGSTVDKIMGGVAYGLEGLRLWEDDVTMITNVGLDFDKYYGDWMKNNNMSYLGVRTTTEYTPYTCVEYHPDGTWHEYSINPNEYYGSYTFGFTKVREDDLTDDICKGLKGMNIELGLDHTFANEVYAKSKKYGFKTMWEIATASCKLENLPKVKEMVKLVDCFSINGPETCDLFGVSTEEECIQKLKELDVPFILFRVGEKGLYSIADGKHYFVPCKRWDGETVDPTGCGNSSTATALWAYAEGYDPLMVGIMSNLTAHYNVRQFGPVLDMSKELRAQMMQQAKEQHQQLSKEYQL